MSILIFTTLLIIILKNPDLVGNWVEMILILPILSFSYLQKR
jgi:hypothetical protein